MQFLIETTSLETRQFIAPFFNGAIFDYPGVNSEEIVVARAVDDKIVGALQYRFSHHNKAAAISFVCVAQGSGMSVFGGMLDRFLQRLEDLGITTFYASVPKEHYDSYGIQDAERQQRIRKRRYPSMLKWTTYLQEVIPPQQISSAHVVKTLTLANRTHMTPTIVIKYELKDEFRRV